MIARLAAVFAIVGLAALTLAACGGGSSGSDLPDAEATCNGAQKRDVVYVRGLGAGRQVHAARADGGSDVILSRGLDLDGAPVITYSGCVVAFLADQGDTVGLWLAAADGSARGRLYTAAQMGGGDIAFAPDGDAIAVVLDGHKLRTVDTGSGESEPLGLSGDYEITSLSWSPDEESIAFAGQPTAEVAPGTRLTPDPWLVDASGGYATQLADTPGIAEYTVDYSYDNRKLAIGGDNGLEILYLPGGAIRSMDAEAGPLTGASWLPDSSALVYARGDGRRSIGPGISVPESTIVAKPLQGGPARPVIGPEKALADPQWTLQGSFP